MTTIDYRAAVARMLAGEDPRTDSVRICLSPKAEHAYLEATRALAAQPAADPEKPTRRKMGDPAPNEAASAAAQAEYDRHSVRVVLSALSAGQWAKLNIRWKAEQDKLDGEALAAYVAGQDRDLVLRCFARFETLDGEPIDELDKSALERLTDPDNDHGLTQATMLRLVRCAFDLCTQEPDLPSSALR